VDILACPRIGRGSRSANEPRSPDGAMAYAPTAVPRSGHSQYVLPWTRLHALKDLLGDGFECWRNFPAYTRPSMCCPRSGATRRIRQRTFDEPWFATAFRPAKELGRRTIKSEIFNRARSNSNYDHCWRVGRDYRIHQWVCAQVRAALQISASATWRDFIAFANWRGWTRSILRATVCVPPGAAWDRFLHGQDKADLRAKQIELLRTRAAGVPARRFHGTG